jgi:hypothetical protein
MDLRSFLCRNLTPVTPNSGLAVMYSIQSDSICPEWQVSFLMTAKRLGQTPGCDFDLLVIVNHQFNTIFGLREIYPMQKGIQRFRQKIPIVMESLQ